MAPQNLRIDLFLSMQMRKEAPIGIFDSGIGGLTVAHAIKHLLPNEQLIYFGDTAHLPYGDKSTAAIQAYAVKITDLLIKNKCKVIVIACNSASAAAHDLLKEYTATRSKVINVIDPIVAAISLNNNNDRIGVIGTRRTIATGIYTKKLNNVKSSLEVKELATPLLVPMIEEGYVENKISGDIIDNYLGNSQLREINTLVLGCTHYPLIKNEIDAYYNGTVKIIDSSIVTAEYLQHYLQREDLLNNVAPLNDDEFYISDYTLGFEYLAKQFFGEPVKLKFYKLWE